MHCDSLHCNSGLPLDFYNGAFNRDNTQDTSSTDSTYQSVEPSRLKAKKPRARSDKPYVRPLSTRSPWTEEQIHQLVQGVRQFPGKWKLISERFLAGAHTNKECRQKAMHLSELGVKKGEWSEEEKVLLVEAMKRHPNKWSLISRDDFRGMRSFYDVKRMAERLNLVDDRPAPKMPRVKYLPPEVEETEISFSDEVLESGSISPLLDLASQSPLPGPVSEENVPPMPEPASYPPLPYPGTEDSESSIYPLLNLSDLQEIQADATSIELDAVLAALAIPSGSLHKPADADLLRLSASDWFKLRESTDSQAAEVS